MHGELSKAKVRIDIDMVQNNKTQFNFLWINKNMPLEPIIPILENFLEMLKSQHKSDFYSEMGSSA
ncbi:hypothetical protein ACFL1B_01120 [Nanoarchaeota archaeon]